MKSLSGKTVLILGGSRMQLPLIEEALLNKMHVVVMDQNKKAIGMQKTSSVIIESISNIDQATNKAFLFHKNIRLLDAVLTVGTDFSLTVSHIAKKLKILGGLPLEDALATTDKEAMRKRLFKANCPQAKFIVLNDLNHLKDLVLPFSFPAVVKPVDSMGSRGVRRVDRKEDLHQASKEAFVFSKKKRIIIESYIQGDEFSLDALIYNKKIHITGIADRKIIGAPYFVELTHTIPSQKDSLVVSQVIQAFKSAIKAMNIKQGAAKGDIRFNPKEGAFIGEIASRLSGGYMSAYTYPYYSGVNLMKAILQVTFGIKPTDLEVKKNQVAMDLGIIGNGGTIKKIHGINKISKIKGVKNIFLNVKVGETIKIPKNNLMKAVNVLIVADNHEKILKLEKKIRSLVVFELI